MTSDDMCSIATAHPLSISRPSHIGSLVCLELENFDKTGDHSCLQAAIDIVQNEAPDPTTYGPHTSTGGVMAFMNFRTALQDELSQQLAIELTVR